MKILLLIWGLYLSCTFQDQIADVKDFDMSKLSGWWYPFLLSSNYSSWEAHNFGSLIYKISVTVDELIIFFSIRQLKKCTRMAMIAFRVETNRYKFKYPGRHEFHVEDADPEDFLLISTINEFAKKFLGVELYSRRQDGTLNEIAKNKFQKLCQLYGLKDVHYIDLTTPDQCYLGETHEN